MSLVLESVLYFTDVTGQTAGRLNKRANIAIQAVLRLH